MKHSILAVLIVIHVVLVAGCSRKDEQSFEPLHNILEDLGATIQAATQRIDFTEDGDPKRYLIRGWQSSEQGGTWAKAKESSLAFYRYDTMHDVELEIVCQAVRARNKRRQEVTLVLNGTAAGSFIPQADALASYQLTLPAPLLQAGRNILEFHFSYITKPSIVDPSSEDSRWLAVKFQTITFRHNDHLKSIDASRLLQRAPSSFDQFLELPSRIELDLEYHSLQGAASFIEFISETGDNQRISLSSKRSTHRQVVHLDDSNSSISQIRFITDGSTDDYTVWERIQLHVPRSQPAPSPSAAGFAKQSRPDILLYVVDTLRADHVGCYGYQRDTTPNLDRFAAENALFRNAYAPSSWTKPSAASILTGLLPKHHETMDRSDKLPDEIETLAETLQEHGYHTIAFITNPNTTAPFGMDQGFIESIKKFSGNSSHELNELIFQFLQTYLLREDRKPLFMLVWTIDPHEPYTPHDDVKDMFDIAQYSSVDTYDTRFLNNVRSGRLGLTDSQIEYVKTRYDQEVYFNDRSFGQLLETLKSLDMYDDALIMFTSDHGEEFFEHGGVGHGNTLYNEAIRVPFVIKSAHIDPGEHHERFQLIDIYPTILDILGLEAPYELDGISLLRPPEDTRALYFEEQLRGNDLKAILGDEKKLIYTKEYYRRPIKQEVPILEMYALDDEYEQHNLDLKSFSDHLMLQQLYSYMYSQSEMNIQPMQIELSPELDQKLRDLGYVK